MSFFNPATLGIAKGGGGKKKDTNAAGAFDKLNLAEDPNNAQFEVERVLANMNQALTLKDEELALYMSGEGYSSYSKHANKIFGSESAARLETESSVLKQKADIRREAYLAIQSILASGASRRSQALKSMDAEEKSAGRERQLPELKRQAAEMTKAGKPTVVNDAAYQLWVNGWDDSIKAADGSLFMTVPQGPLGNEETFKQVLDNGILLGRAGQTAIDIVSKHGGVVEDSPAARIRLASARTELQRIADEQEAKEATALRAEEAGGRAGDQLRLSIEAGDRAANEEARKAELHPFKVAEAQAKQDALDGGVPPDMQGTEGTEYIRTISRDGRVTYTGQVGNKSAGWTLIEQFNKDRLIRGKQVMGYDERISRSFQDMGFGSNISITEADSSWAAMHDKTKLDENGVSNFEHMAQLTAQILGERYSGPLATTIMLEFMEPDLKAHILGNNDLMELSRISEYTDYRSPSDINTQHGIDLLNQRGDGMVNPTPTPSSLAPKKKDPNSAVKLLSGE